MSFSVRQSKNAAAQLLITVFEKIFLEYLSSLLVFRESAILGHSALSIGRRKLQSCWLVNK